MVQYDGIRSMLIKVERMSDEVDEVDDEVELKSTSNADRQADRIWWAEEGN